MSYIPTKKEFEAIIQQDIDKRVKHFQNRVGGHQCLWLCIDNEGNLFSNYDEKGRECISVWPAKEYAELIIAKKDQKLLKKLNIQFFLDEYCDELKENNIYLMVFPTSDGGALFNVDDFRNLMEEELAKYGDYDDEHEDNSLEKRLGKNKEYKD